MSDSFGLRHFTLVAALYLAHLLSPFAAQAQTGISFGGAKQDRKQPVTIDADQLDVEQSSNKAVFTGNVIAIQGVLRLEAPFLQVDYDETSKAIALITATGGVKLENGVETATSDHAVYDLKTGLIEITGDVLLNQDTTTIAGPMLIIDVEKGTGLMQGRVKSVFSTVTK